MYHFFVRRRIREIFRRLNLGDFQFIIQQFAPEAEHWFSGSHALSGSRHSPELIAAWYQRLGIVLKGIQFKIRKIIISGPPWRTLVAVEWNDYFVSGNIIPNQGVFIITLHWGRVTEFHVYCDTQKLEKNLDMLASQGLEEAKAPPIQS